MVNIPLIKNFRLKSDPHNWIICETRGSREFNHSFHSSMESALISFAEARLRESQASSINSLLEAQKSLVAGLNKALTPLNIQVLTKKTGREGDEARSY